MEPDLGDSTLASVPGSPDFSRQTHPLSKPTGGWWPGGLLPPGQHPTSLLKYNAKTKTWSSMRLEEALDNFCGRNKYALDAFLGHRWLQLENELDGQ